MTLEQLAILVALSRTHSMSICAKNLNMTKTNISKSISQLENELSAKLFFKSRQGSYLTPLGERVCECAERILKEKNAITVLCSDKGPKAETLNIIFTEAYAFIIPEITENFQKHISDTGILHLTSLPSGHLNQIITYINPDLAFSTVATNELSTLAEYKGDYYIYKINDEPMLLMIHRSNLPCDIVDGQISIKQLKNYSLLVIGNEFLLPNHSMEQSIIGERFLKQNGLFENTSIIQSNSLLLFKQYLTKPYYGLLCDAFAMKNSQLLSLDDYVFLTIKPVYSISRVILLNKTSPYLTLLNETLFYIQNRFEDDFAQLQLLNDAL